VFLADKTKLSVSNNNGTSARGGTTRTHAHFTHGRARRRGFVILLLGTYSKTATDALIGRRSPNSTQVMDQFSAVVSRAWNCILLGTERFWRIQFQLQSLLQYTYNNAVTGRWQAAQLPQLTKKTIRALIINNQSPTCSFFFQYTDQEAWKSTLDIFDITIIYLDSTARDCSITPLISYHAVSRNQTARGRKESEVLIYLRRLYLRNTTTEFNQWIRRSIVINPPLINVLAPDGYGLLVQFGSNPSDDGTVAAYFISWYTTDSCQPASLSARLASIYLPV
jgi:hypothetical protein